MLGKPGQRGCITFRREVVGHVSVTIPESATIIKSTESGLDLTTDNSL